MTGNHLKSMLALLKSMRLTVTLLAAAAILAACPTVSRWLEYDRELVCSGQVWRIMTCHLTHCNLDHLLWDALALGLLGALCERHHRSQYLRCLLVCSVAIPAAVLAWQPEMLRYRGLSGLDTGLFALLAVGLINDKLRQRDRVGLTVVCLFVLGLAGKVAFELATGSTIFVDNAAAGFTPAPLAHVIGLLVGAAMGLKRFRQYSVAVKELLALSFAGTLRLTKPLASLRRLLLPRLHVAAVGYVKQPERSRGRGREGESPVHGAESAA